MSKSKIVVKMSVVPKALFTWFLILVFFILLVLRVDEKVEWNWFIIFIPLWLLDASVLTFIIVNMVMHYVKLYIQNVDRNEMTKTRKYVLIVCCLLKIIFQVLLCLRLENFPINLYLVLIPFWTLFIAGLIDNFRILVLRHPYR